MWSGAGRRIRTDFSQHGTCAGAHSLRHGMDVASPGARVVRAAGHSTRRLATPGLLLTSAAWRLLTSSQKRSTTFPLQSRVKCDHAMEPNSIVPCHRRKCRARPSSVRGETAAGVEPKAPAEARSDGAEIFAHACKLGFEGIVSKDRTRPYRSGPSNTWIKTKNLQAPGVLRFEDRDALA